MHATLKQARLAIGLRLLLAGFLTIAAQAVLVRELFAALYGSDLAIGFTLASWTLLGGIGAMLAGHLPARVHRLGPALLPAYVGLVVAILLWIRHWGSTELLSFGEYGRIPLFLLAPCLVGGALFPILAAGLDAPGEDAPLSRAYGLETVGGLLAGAMLAILFLLGASSLPLLASLAFLALAAALPRDRWIPAGTCAGVVALALLPFTPAGRRLETWSLGLRYPRQKVLDHRNTPYGFLVATERNRRRTVYENGLPIPDALDTPAKTITLALAAAYAPQWERICTINAHANGFGNTIAKLTNCDVTCLEADPYLSAFARRWSPNRSEPAFPIRFGTAPADMPAHPCDLIAVFASPPGSLMTNRFISTEFAALLKKHLTPNGVLVVVLPRAPGFMHPLQQRYVDSVFNALALQMPHVSEVTTDLGAALLVAAPRPPVVCPTAILAERLRNLPPVIRGEVRRIADMATHPDLFGVHNPRNATPNSVRDPVAYFAYLHFRGTMLEETREIWQRVFREKPLSWTLILLGAVAVACLLHGRRMPGAGGVFWASWMSTMATMLSVYVYQSIVGQAYWVVSLLVGVSMLGISLGAFTSVEPRIVRLSSLSFLFLAFLFSLYRLLAHLPSGLLLSILLAGNIAIGLTMGWRFAGATAMGGATVKHAGGWFAVDLLGATCGLLIGSILLCWWSGFQTASLLCAGVALVACLGSYLPPSPRP